MNPEYGIRRPSVAFCMSQEMQRKKLLIFDLDGTLIDSIVDLTEAVNRMRATFGMGELAREQVRGMVGRGARNLVERALPGIGAEEIEKGLAFFLAYNQEHLLDNTRLYPGVEETLRLLNGQDRVMAVISNKNTDLCRMILSACGVDSLFRTILGADAVAEPKPSPQPLLMLLKEFSISAPEGLMIGDSINDISAGKAAGMQTVGCTYGYGWPDELTDSDWKIDSFRHLLDLPI